MNEIILIVGPQGSGKSSSVQSYLDRGYVRLNRDEAGGNMIALAASALSILLVQKRSIVADNTFPTIESRKLFVDVAKHCGATISAVEMATSIEDCQYNICQRMVERYGRLLICEEIKESKDPNVFPPAVLFKYRKEYQPPTLLEGFQTVTRVPFVRLKNLGFLQKAVIFDKDGTLTECKSGAKFPCTVDDIRALPGRKETLKKWKDKGYRLLGISNQSGVAKGLLTEATLKKIFVATNKMLDATIEWKYCPHSVPPITCWCRKPQIGNLVEFIFQHYLNASQCIVIGDMTTDKTCATRAGMQFTHADEFFK